VLDLGTHSGALLARLRDRGFTDLAGADLDRTEFALDDVPFKYLNLNEPFASRFDRQFKLACCTDVLEHMDSPRAFLMEVHELLADDGYLAVSIPNIAFWEGRLKFLLTGELWGFGERNYRNQRHISPCTHDQMRLTMEELGFKLVAWDTAGTFAAKWRQMLMLPLWLPVRIIGGPQTLGETALFIFRKARPDASLVRPVHYRECWQKSAELDALEKTGGR